ncbi:MAG: beta-glucosidase [Armatimonadetes bacterium]|nr:beta-glucosidase [Armatimonadota bacterium]MBS1700913.1 beta-glucosidase [Armatimonadota bacterium]
MPFSNDFSWGVATASYQIEGSPYMAGGGHSVWDMFCQRPGKVLDGSNGAVACDHYNRYREDAALMKELGIPNYRMSIAWPRVIPDGTGAVSEKGLDFYDRLIDELLANGVKPHVTLYHWDTPYEVYLRGGWLNPDISEWFARYTEIVVKKLGDRVASWMTLNEPQCFIGLGMENGHHAPGDKLGKQEVLWAAHNALLSHGKAVQVIRANVKDSRIGWAPVGQCAIPASDKPEDVQAARMLTTEMTTVDTWSTPLWSDPVFFGKYPKVVEEFWETCYRKPTDADMKTIAQPLDFYGANIYHASTVKMGQDGKPETVEYPFGGARTIYHWPITPEALYWGPKFFYERYGKPIVITENGMGLSDWVQLDGKIHDPQRIDYVTRYLRQLERAATDGVQVDGYFLWSFMDNFEWNEGFRFRFGLVHVDYETQKRTPKESAYWYRDVIRSNGASIH